MTRAEIETHENIERLARVADGPDGGGGRQYISHEALARERRGGLRFSLHRSGAIGTRENLCSSAGVTRCSCARVFAERKVASTKPSSST